MPVFGILYCGDSFEFYKFDGSFNSAKFFRGYHGTEYQFQVPDYSCVRGSDPQCCQTFLCDLRTITEIIFDVLFMAYSSSLKAYRLRTIHSKEKTESSIKWDNAIEYADTAQQMFRDGGIKCGAGHIQEANEDALQAMPKLKLRYDFFFMIQLSCNSGLYSTIQHMLSLWQTTTISDGLLG